VVPRWPRFLKSEPPEGRSLEQGGDPERRQEESIVAIVGALVIQKHDGSVGRSRGHCQDRGSKPGDNGTGALERGDDRDETHIGLLPMAEGRSHSGSQNSCSAGGAGSARTAHGDRSPMRTGGRAV
jgi:hypothetical protein